MLGKLVVKVISTESYKNGNHMAICEVIYRTSPVYSHISLVSTEVPSSKGFLYDLISCPRAHSVHKVYEVVFYQQDVAKKVENMFLFLTCFGQQRAKEIFHIINGTLSPMITGGDIFFSEFLLNEILLPEPKDSKHILCKLISLINNSPCTYPDWPKLLQCLIQQLCRDEKVTVSAILLDQYLSNPSMCEISGESIFHEAAKAQSGRSIKVLLSLLKPEDRKIVIAAKDADGNTPLSIALRHRNYTTAKCLIKAGAEVRGHIFEAVEMDSYELLQEMVEVSIGLHQNILLQAMMNESDALTDFTPLMLAVMRQHESSTLQLLLGGANPNLPHPQTGDTALHIAASLSNATLVKALIVFEAQIMLRNNLGETASDKAASRGHYDIVSIFDEIEAAAEKSYSYDTRVMANRIQLDSNSVTLLNLHGDGMDGLLLIQMLSMLDKGIKSIAASSKPVTAYFDYISGSGMGGLISLLLTYHRGLTYLDMMGLVYGVMIKLLNNNKTTNSMECLFKDVYGEATTMSSRTKPRLTIPINPIGTGKQQVCPPAGTGCLITNFDKSATTSYKGRQPRVWEAAQSIVAALFLSKEITAFGNNPTMAEIHKQAKAESGKGIKIGCSVFLGTDKIADDHERKLAPHDIHATQMVGEVEQLCQSNNLESNKTRTSTSDFCFQVVPDRYRDLNSVCIDHKDIVQHMYHNHLSLIRERKKIDNIARLLSTKYMH